MLRLTRIGPVKLKLAEIMQLDTGLGHVTLPRFVLPKNLAYSICNSYHFNLCTVT